MMRISALAAAVLCITGCFVFDNPFDIRSVGTSSTPTVTFQVVITGPSLSGTYVWSSPDNAYKTMISGTPFFLYMDGGGVWGVKWSVSPNAYSTYTSYSALPTASGSNWVPMGEIWTVDDSAGGISVQGSPPDSLVSNGSILQVTFKASDPGNSATYQWERSDSAAFLSASAVGTGSPTYLTTVEDASKWIRVSVTPTDSTGTVQGTPVASQPVKVQ
jgi:hypothetical protein